MYFKLNKKIFVHKSFVLLLFTFIFRNTASFYFTMLLCALLHEAAHALSAVILGKSVERFYFSPYGCELRLTCSLMSQEVIILISGPAFSLVLAFFSFFLGFDGFFRANAILFALNMLPAYPLDGGKLLKIALWHFFGVYRGNKALKAVSFTIAFCLFCAALPFESVWLTVISVLIFRRTKNLNGTPFYQKRRKFTPIKVFSAAHDITILQALRLFSPYYYTYVFAEDKNILYTERDIINIARDGDYTRLL